MNKATKGAVAAGAAALLLAGGAGTMAAWNANAPLNGGTISSGKLTLTTQGTPSWTVSNATVNGGTAAPVTISTFKVSPGDVLTYSGSVKIGAVGNNLSATLKADASTITGTGTLKAEMAPVTTATVGATPLPTNGTGVVITSANNDNVVSVNVVFDFTKAPATNSSQDSQVDLTNFNVTLDQA
ncbi:alternate-type signal peptide domain-containing protein [Rhodococcus sp. NPDC055024]